VPQNIVKTPLASDLQGTCGMPTAACWWLNEAVSWATLVPIVNGEDPTSSSSGGNRIQRFLALFDRGTLTALTVVGLALFILVRLGLLLFYENFGVSPDEVGFDYLRTLAQSLYGFAYLAFLSGLLFAAFMLGLIICVAIWGLLKLAYRRIRTRDPVPFAIYLKSYMNTVRRLTALAWSLLLPALLLGFLTVTVAFLSLAHSDGQQALKGRGVVPYGEYALPVYPWQAVPTVVNVLDSNSASQITNGSCYLLLGEADGITVLYDPREQVTVRLPTGAIELRTQPGEGFRPQC
jgi:hypothetical protein